MFITAIMGSPAWLEWPMHLRRHIEGANLFFTCGSITAPHREASLARCSWQWGALLMNSRINKLCWVRRDQLTHHKWKPPPVMENLLKKKRVWSSVPTSVFYFYYFYLTNCVNIFFFNSASFFFFFSQHHLAAEGGCHGNTTHRSWLPSLLL